MTTYRDLFDKFSNGHNRLLSAMGQEAFQSQVLGKFPLTLTDDDVRGLALQFGWQDEWNQARMSKRAKAKASQVLSHDVGQMLSGALGSIASGQSSASGESSASGSARSTCSISTTSSGHAS